MLARVIPSPSQPPVPPSRTTHIPGSGGVETLPMLCDPPPDSAVDQQPSRHPECPRCGYDLSGETARWESQCPLTGICTECGLDIAWRDILSQRLRMPRWWLEASMRFRPTTLVRTWARVLRPWRFWRNVRMEFPIRPRRLVVFTLMALVLAHCAAAVAAVWSAMYLGQLSFTGTIAIFHADEYADVLRLAIAPGLDRPWYEDGFPGAWGWLMFAWMLLISSAFGLLGDSFRLANVRKVHLVRGAAYSLTILPLILAFEMLCDAIRRTGWSTGWIWSLPDFIQQVVTHRGPIGLLVIAIWSAIYWHTFIRRYLHMPHAIVIVPLMLITALLAALAIVAYFPGADFQYDVIDYLWGN